MHHDSRRDIPVIADVVPVFDRQLRPVAVATRSVDEYPSLANAAERYAESVWERYLPTDPPPPIWVENPTCDGMNATPAIVEFTVSDDRRLVDPQWNWLEPGDLAMLVVSASWEGVPGSAV